MLWFNIDVKLPHHSWRGCIVCVMCGMVELEDWGWVLFFWLRWLRWTQLRLGPRAAAIAQ